MKEVNLLRSTISSMVVCVCDMGITEDCPRHRALANLDALAARVAELEAENARLLQERLDYSNVTTKDGLNASEWIWRTGKAERERDRYRAAIQEMSQELSQENP